jgi:putative DNA primase/helicase
MNASSAPILEAARRLHDLGYWIVPIRAGGEVLRRKNPRHDKESDQPEFLEKVSKGKEPIGFAWGARRRAWAEIERTIRAVPGRGYGIVLGPGRGPGDAWLIDAEGDGPDAEESWLKLCAGEVVETVGHRSRRGIHRFLVVDGERLLSLLAKAGSKPVKDKPGVYHLPELPGLELRVSGPDKKGVVKQLQSVGAPCPGEDGRPRTWLPGKALATLPEASYAWLASIEKPRDLGPYGRKALAEESALFAAKGPGERHAFLLESSNRLASLVKAGALEEREALEELRSSARANKLADEPGREQEVDEIWDSAMARVQARRIPEKPATPRVSANGDDDHRPVISITTEEADVNDLAIDALKADRSVYRRNFSLVAVARDSRPKHGAGVKRAEGTPVIRPIQKPRLREVLTRNIRWKKTIVDRDGKFRDVKAHPPDWSVAAIMAREEWPEIRYLVGIVEVPTLRADGSVIEAAGYDRPTGLLYVPSGSFPAVPAESTREDAQQAAASLLELVGDFPFRDGHEAAWLAALLTPLVRHLIDGPVPLFLFEANTSGAGKTLLCDLIAVITTGRVMTRTGYYHDAIEMDKQIVATALAGDRVVLFDNVDNGGRLGNSSLDRALTGRTYRGRILGRSEMTPDLDLISVFYCTGNNLSLCGDIPRRIIPGRLESPMEHPEERDDFAIKSCDCGCKGDLLAHAGNRRGECVVAALTIIRAYIRAGRPVQPLKAMDFSAWCQLVRNAVYWATDKDPAVGRKDLDESDPDRQKCIALIDGWHEVQTARDVAGLTSAEMHKILSRALPEEFAAIRNALSALWPKIKAGELPSSGSIGMKVQALRDKPLGDKCFKAIGVEHQAKVWAAIPLTPCGESRESRESSSHHSARITTSLQKSDVDDSDDSSGGKSQANDGKQAPQTPKTPPGPICGIDFHIDDPDAF